MTAAFAALAVIAGGLLIYDATRADRIARGVRVAGLDVGGLTRGQARRAVEARLAGAIEHPVVATWRHRRFTLAPRDSRVRLDVAATVDRAVARSRRGDPFGRALRELTGGEVRADVAPVVRYSPVAVRRFVRGLARRLDRRARDADIDFVAYRIRKTRARNGRRLRQRELEQAIVARLSSPRRDELVAVHVVVSRRPDRTLKDIARRYPRVITISRTRKILRLYRHLKLAETFRIAVGQIGHKTPAGRYAIESMQKNPAWNVPDEAWAGDLAGRIIPPGDPQNPLKARWMGFHDGAGIHGTSVIGSLGSAASHGCIRMSVPDVVKLYRRVKVGTPVFIA
jgi:lipoprotein-anchoring transpeptidase ErfK/SrfK